MACKRRGNELLRHRIELREELLQIPHVPLEPLSVPRPHSRLRRGPTLRPLVNAVRVRGVVVADVIRRRRRPLLLLLDFHLEALVVRRRRPQDRVLLHVRVRHPTAEIVRVMIGVAGAVRIRHGRFEIPNRRPNGRPQISSRIIYHGHEVLNPSSVEFLSFYPAICVLSLLRNRSRDCDEGKIKKLEEMRGCWKSKYLIS